MGQIANVNVIGKIQYYMELARDTSADIGAMLLQAAGLQTDTQLADFVSVATLLGTTNTEATFTNYARKILPAPVLTVDNSLDQINMGISGAAPVTVRWNNAGGTLNNTIGKIVFYYDPTPGSSANSALIPLSYHDASANTDGTSLVFTLATLGLLVARKGPLTPQGVDTDRTAEVE